MRRTSLQTKRELLLKAIADILEVPSVEDATILDPWDSLCVMQAVVAIDDICGKVVHGRALVYCKLVQDVLKVADEA